MSYQATLEKDSMSKRKYGTGTVRKRGDSWQISYRPLPGGKRVWETVGKESAGITEADAEHMLMERLVQIGRGEGSTFLGHPFAAVASEWRQQVEALNDFSDRTLELYDNALEVHLLPAFGDDFLHQIDAPVIERYCSKKLTLAPGQPGAVPVEGEVANRRKDPVGKRTIEQHLSVLNLIFRYAVRNKMMTANPIPEVEIRPSKKKEVKVLEQNEVKNLLMHCRDEEQETLFLLLSATGLRLGEALALRITDFDDTKQVLKIERTQTRKGGKTVISKWGTKTDAGKRELKVSDYLAMRLRRQIARSEMKSKKQRVKILFANNRGNMHAESNIRNRWFLPALEAAGLNPEHTPHSLRHTFASECIAAGLPDTQIAYYLGHKSPQTTRLIYAHIFDRHKQSIADLASIYSHDPVDN